MGGGQAASRLEARAWPRGDERPTCLVHLRAGGEVRQGRAAHCRGYRNSCAGPSYAAYRPSVRTFSTGTGVGATPSPLIWPAFMPRRRLWAEVGSAWAITAPAH